MFEKEQPAVTVITPFQAKTYAAVQRWLWMTLEMKSVLTVDKTWTHSILHKGKISV